MTNKELRTKIESYLNKKEASAKLFNNPDFDNSIIGISQDNRIVYDLDKMIEEFMQDNGCSYTTALEYIGYNTLRVLEYYKDAPILIKNINKLE